MKKYIIIVGTLLLSLFVLTGCSTKLKNGEEAAVSFKDGGISANDFYEILKSKYSEDEIVDAIDTYILNIEYKDDSSKNDKDVSESVYVEEQYDEIEKQASENDIEFETYIKNYFNVTTSQQLREYLALNYKRNKYIEDYLKESVTDKEIESYYDEKIVGDMKLSHILISPNVSDDASDEEKEKADKEAYNKAKDIIKKLDKGASFSELASKYSEDESNKNTGGDLGYVNREGYDEGFIEGAIPLKVGSYTKKPVKSAYGYHIIYKEKQKKKDSKEDVEDDIRETIAKEKLEADSTLSYQALEALREKYKMNIKDSTLKKAYKHAVDKMYNTNQD